MPKDSAFSDDFTFRTNDPWEADVKRRRDLGRRGKKTLTPGAGRRVLLGLPDDLQPETGESLMASLDRRSELNKWDLAKRDEEDQREEREDADEDKSALGSHGWTDGERFMWRFLYGSKPSDKRQRSQSWIDEQRKRRDRS